MGGGHEEEGEVKLFLPSSPPYLIPSRRSAAAATSRNSSETERLLANQGTTSPLTSTLPLDLL